MNALNPVLRVADRVIEPLLVHQGLQREAALARVRRVPDGRCAAGLHGAIRVRAQRRHATARGSGDGAGPEPHSCYWTSPSALDVLTQANIMNVLKRIKREAGTSFILITHDIATSSELADRVAVMYAGHLWSRSATRRASLASLCPYSQKLLASVPRLRQEQRLEYIPGRPLSADRCAAWVSLRPRC